MVNYNYNIDIYVARENIELFLQLIALFSGLNNFFFLLSNKH